MGRGTTCSGRDRGGWVCRLRSLGSEGGLPLQGPSTCPQDACCIWKRLHSVVFSPHTDRASHSGQPVTYQWHMERLGARSAAGGGAGTGAGAGAGGLKLPPLPPGVAFEQVYEVRGALGCCEAGRWAHRTFLPPSLA